MNRYIDTHNHILPGLDDGPPTLKGAIDMAHIALRNGITKIIATPHHNNYHRPSKQEILAAHELLTKGLRKEDVPVDIYPGQELRIAPDLPDQLNNKEVLSLAGSKYILLEFPFDGIPLFAEDTIFRLRLDGWIPILAHVERIYDLQQKPDRLKKFIEMGCLTQVNTNSLTGELGRTSYNAAVTFLKRGQVTMLATDAHSSEYRVPDFTEALEVAARFVGRQAAENMASLNPGEILKTV